MKKLPLLLLMLALWSCSKSKNDNTASVYGVWYVNGVAHIVDSTTLYMNAVSARRDNDNYVSISFDSAVPTKSRVDTIRKYPTETFIALRENGKPYLSRGGSAVLISTREGDRMVFSFTEIEMVGYDSSIVKVSGNIIYKP